VSKTKLFTLLFFVLTITHAQKSFYEAIEANGETATYEGFAGKSANGDGTYNFVRGKPAVTITVTKLSSGQPVGFVAKPVSADYGGFKETEISDYGRVDSYPNVMSIKHNRTNDGYIMIDDMLFVVNNIPDNGVPKLVNVTAVYVMVKDRTEGKGDTGKKKKKKGGFFKRMKSKLESTGQSETFKYIKTLNIEKIFNDYVTAMKAKQSSPLTSKDRADIAKILRAREAGDEEIKRYNDSIKATPEYKDLQRRKKLNEENYQAAKAQNYVTLRNNSSTTIYVAKSNSSNRGTEIRSGSTATWNCDQDAYLQKSTKSGGSIAYSSTNIKVYSGSKSGCGKTININ
jgi:hypothetical protein